VNIYLCRFLIKFNVEKKNTNPYKICIEYLKMRIKDYIFRGILALGMIIIPNSFNFKTNSLNNLEISSKKNIENLVDSNTKEDSLDYRDVFANYELNLKEDSKPKELDKERVKRQYKDLCNLLFEWEKNLNESLAYEDSLFLEREKLQNYEKIFNDSIKDNHPEFYSRSFPEVPKDVFEILIEKEKNRKFNNWSKKYFVLSKLTNELFVFNNRHRLLGKTAILRGKEKGDYYGKDFFTTPSGEGIIFYSEKTPEIYWNFSTPFYRIKFSKPEDVPLMHGIHGVYLPEYEERIEKLKSENKEDNLTTQGCINCNRLWLLNHEPFPGDSIFITKEPEEFDLNNYSQKINIKSPISLEEYESLKTEYAREQKIPFNIW